MELTVTQKNFQKALSAVVRVAGHRELPILNNILLRTDNNRLKLAATDLEIASTQHIGAKIAKPGHITVPAKLITEFVGSIPAGNVELKVVDGTKLRVKSGKFISTFNGIDADDFPELPTINSEEAVSFAFGAQDFKGAVAETTISADNSGHRAMLQGVYWNTAEGALFLASTDGYRLSERKLIDNVKSSVDAIVPLKTMLEVQRLVGDDNEEVEVHIDNTQIHIRVDEAEVTSGLIDGKFPDYRQLKPSKNAVNAVVDRAEFARITKISGLFSRDSGGGITLQFNAETKTLKMHSIASELGENTSETEVEIDNDGQITLNSRYLTDLLGVMHGNELSLRFNGKMSPCVFTNPADDSFYHIIMPLKS